jgi:class 3 adenylate cyclase/tetratricopeptide (TPR) repeat protein
VTSRCLHCGNLNRSEARFCDACGTALAASPVDQREVVPKEIKYATALFADIVGSTEMVAELAPDEAQAILSPAVEAMADVIRALGGTLNQVVGDGVMALFGVPVSQEDHALRACCAALDLHVAVAKVYSTMQLRIGIASGLTLFSTPAAVTADADAAFPAFGATIHLASRLQSLSRPGTTLCASSTRALSGPTVELVPLGPQAVRGFGLQQDIFALTGMRRGRSRFGGSVGRGLSPYIGRDLELRILLGVAYDVLQHRSAVVAIVGDAGVGKSRLAWEFSHSLQTDGWRQTQVEAVSYGRSLPYHFIVSLLYSLCTLNTSTDSHNVAHEIRGLLGESKDAAGHLPPLLSLLGLPLYEHEAGWDRLDPFQRRDAMRDAIRFIIVSVAKRQPLLLLLEDLQWADDESLRLLDFLPPPDCRLFLLATYRSDFALRWTQLQPKAVSLKPLTSESMELIAQHAFPAITNEPLRRLLIERSAGNPFFMEELARDAQATQTSERETHTLDGPVIPSTIQAVISARIDRLSKEQKLMLISASALGSRFSLKVLSAVFRDVSQPIFRMQLGGLCDAGMLRPVGSVDSEGWFSHALIQEVAYASLPRLERRDLHGQVVAAIKRVEPDRLDDFAETLVYHAARGEVWKDVAEWAGTAGRRAASRSAYAEAALFFIQGIDACQRLPPSQDAMSREIDLRFDLRSSIFPTAEIHRSLENSMRAEQLAGMLGEKRRLGWATAYLAKDLQLVGKPGAALAAAERALRLAEGYPELIIATRYFSAQAAYAHGDYAYAVSTLRGLITTLEQRDRLLWAGTPGPSVIFYRAWLIWSLARMGRATEAHKEAVEMRQLADDADLPLSRTIAHLSEGFALAFAGRLQEAEQTLCVSLSLCQRWELFAWSTNILSCLGHVLAHLGRFDEALDHLEQAVERTRSIGVFVSHANELAWLAEAYHLSGRVERAVQHAEEAINMARAHEERGNEALATVVLGEALAALGSISEAKAHCAAAMKLATEIGMAPMIPRCLAILQLTEDSAVD